MDVLLSAVAVPQVVGLPPVVAPEVDPAVVPFVEVVAGPPVTDPMVVPEVDAAPLVVVANVPVELALLVAAPVVLPVVPDVVEKVGLVLQAPKAKTTEGRSERRMGVP